jgi:hypothetical protein
MYRVSEDYRFIGRQPVHQVLITLDESRLFRGVELA